MNPTGIARRLLGLAWLGVLSVAGAAEPAAPAPAVLADIALARRDDGRWEARYALPAPATRLVFERVDPDATRARDWTPLDPAFSIVIEQGREVVRRRDGAPFSRVGFAMRPLYVPLRKDYAPFSPFGDGGLLLHTGRFHACADDCPDPAARPAWRMRLAPPPGDHVVLGGRVLPAADVLDADDGTNLYVGRTTPVETPDLVAVIDGAMPDAIRARLTALLPRLMHLYGAQLGALPDRPMLFASRDAAHPGGGYGYQGGTLPGQVFMHVYGRHPSFATPAFAARLDAFFAHEAAHLYQRYPPLADEGDSWIHEGGADALAAVALQRLGEANAAATALRVGEARDACAASLAAGALAGAHARGDVDADYRCGFVLQMAVDAAARRASGGACDLFCVWRDFQAHVRAGAPWTGDTFIAAAAARGGPALARFLREMVDAPVRDPAGRLDAGLRAAGLVAADG